MFYIQIANIETFVVLTTPCHYFGHRLTTPQQLTIYITALLLPYRISFSLELHESRVSEYLKAGVQYLPPNNLHEDNGEIAQMVRRLLRIPAIPGSKPVVSMLQRALYLICNRSS